MVRGGSCNPTLTAKCAVRMGHPGFEVQEASDGEAALELAERRQFDVAVLDMMMPGISGLQLLEKLKASHKSTRFTSDLRYPSRAKASTAFGPASIPPRIIRVK